MILGGVQEKPFSQYLLRIFCLSQLITNELTEF